MVLTDWLPFSTRIGVWFDGLTTNGDGLTTNGDGVRANGVRNGVLASGLAAAAAAIAAATTTTAAAAGQVGLDFGASDQVPGVGADETQVGAVAVLGYLRLE